MGFLYSTGAIFVRMQKKSIGSLVKSLKNTGSPRIRLPHIGLISL